MAVTDRVTELLIQRAKIASLLTLHSLTGTKVKHRNGIVGQSTALIAIPLIFLGSGRAILNKIRYLLLDLNWQE